jgi:hypothetical protein
MSQNRSLLLPLLGCVALLLAGSLGLPSFLPFPVRGEDNSTGPAPPALPAQPPPVLDPTTARPDPAANRLLDHALSRPTPTWLETELWQQVTVQGFVSEVEGRYLSGPNRRFRLDLATYHGGTEGRLRILSNGQYLWQATRIGGGGWIRASKVDLAEVGDEVPGQALTGYLHSQAGGGPAALLAHLRKRLTWVRGEMVMRQGVLLAKLTGTWTPAALAEMKPAANPAGGSRPAADASLLAADRVRDWPAGLPRQCRLYLDGKTLWPHRLEWWGPDPPQPGEALLVAMEWRRPVVDRPLSAAQCTQLFTWQDGDVPDATDEVLEQLRDKKHRN